MPELQNVVDIGFSASRPGSDTELSRKIAEPSDVNKVQAGVKVAEQPVEKASELSAQREAFFEEIRQNLEKLNEYIPLKATNLIFEFDDLGDPPVVKVIDRENDEVIREIPPKEFRDVAKALEEFADKVSSKAGVFFDQTI